MKTYILLLFFVIAPFHNQTIIKKIDFDRVYLRVFKTEKILEVWINRSGSGDKFVLYKKYDICKISGILGPKRREGDFQVPEGFYYINDFNYHSKYYLSLGLNYPNKSDAVLSRYKNLGGSIYIHGNCVSVGCLAMGNDNIKEIFLMCEKARQLGQREIQVHIFPVNFNDTTNNNKLKKFITNNKTLISFESNIQQGFEYFESHKKPPHIEVDSLGTYLFIDP